MRGTILLHVSEIEARSRAREMSDADALRKDLLAISSRLRSIELALGLEGEASRGKTERGDTAA